MSNKRTEACGRCSMSTIVDAAGDTDRPDRDPFGTKRIEVDEDELRRIAPAAWMQRVTTRLNRAAQRLIYGQ